MNEATTKTVNDGYNLFTNNCTDNVKSALDAGGLKNGEWSYGCPMPIPNFSPRSKQAQIERANKGTDVDNKLKRK
jgi:hypothetical protein